MTLCNYLMAMKAEINPSRNYKATTLKVLCYLSKFHKNKPFEEMDRDDALFYLDSLHKTEILDPQHKSVGTYNFRRAVLLRFFKWLYSPNEEQDRRKKPPVVQNVPKLKRKEISTIKPSDLWDEEDDQIFLKYCSNKRDRAFHILAKESSCRPSEILGLKVKDFSFQKTIDGKIYAQITVNGKTGTRNIPVFGAVPYLKDWLLNGHPTGTKNPNAYLIPSMDTNLYKNIGSRMNSGSANLIYRRYKLKVFPKLLEDPNVPHEDKAKIQRLLQKPFFPYVLRHSSLTHKARKLTAPLLRQHAGWTPGSNMELKYTHFFGAESNDTILSEIYGLETAATLKAKKMSVAMIPITCPNCKEPNIPDSKWCNHCQMLFTTEAHHETIQAQKEKDERLDKLQRMVEMQQANMEKYIREQIESYIKQNKEDPTIPHDNVRLRGIIHGANIEAKLRGIESSFDSNPKEEIKKIPIQPLPPEEEQHDREMAEAARRIQEEEVRKGNGNKNWLEKEWKQFQQQQQQQQQQQKATKKKSN